MSLLMTYSSKIEERVINEVLFFFLLNTPLPAQKKLVESEQLAVIILNKIPVEFVELKQT